MSIMPTKKEQRLLIAHGKRGAAQLPVPVLQQLGKVFDLRVRLLQSNLEFKIVHVVAPRGPHVGQGRVFPGTRVQVRVQPPGRGGANGLQLFRRCHGLHRLNPAYFH